MPFIDLNPSPTVQPGNQNPVAVNPSQPVNNATPPSAVDGAHPVVQESQNDLLSRLKSFTNFTKDEASDELAPLEGKEQSTISLAETTPAQPVPEVQEFSGPDFPSKEEDVVNVVEPTLDQKIAQVNTNLQGLVAETPAPASFTPAPAPIEAKPEPEVSETQGDVTDDIVIGTESGVSDTVIEEAPEAAKVEEQLPEATTLPTPVENVNTSVVPATEINISVPTAAAIPAPEITVTEPVAEVPANIPEVSAPGTQPAAEISGELTPITADANVGDSLSGMQLQVKQYDLDEILKQALSKGASDVHLNTGYRAIARIDGDLSPLQSQVMDEKLIKQMLLPVIAHKGLKSLDGIFDLDIAYALPDKSARFRVNIYKEKESFAAVFRLIPEKIRTIEELNLPSILRQFIDMEQGLVLVTGATGSGKSTTIAALVNEINQAYPKHIVTVEDPIEYIYPSGKAIVSQRNVGEDTLSWGDSLRSVLRQDPNIVVIGEMRDLETISAAMTVAETGHLVFATLHTNSAAQSVDRIIDVFPEFQQNQIRTQLANVLTAVVCQKLLPVSGGGRRVAVEIMLANSAVRAAIREHNVYQIDNMIQTSADVGMISMEKSLFQLVKDGLISPEVATQFANKPGDLLTLLR